jgi:hypothetical protein
MVHLGMVNCGIACTSNIIVRESIGTIDPLLVRTIQARLGDQSRFEGVNNFLLHR